MAKKTQAMSFGSMPQGDVPKGRNGKHKAIVSKIMFDLEHLEPGRALKISLEDLPDSKQNIRAALNRVTREQGMDVSTSSDRLYLYVWETKSNAAR